jgi:hypothetical protein
MSVLGSLAVTLRSFRRAPRTRSGALGVPAEWSRGVRGAATSKS